MVVHWISPIPYSGDPFSLIQGLNTRQKGEVRQAFTNQKAQLIDVRGAGNLFRLAGPVLKRPPGNAPFARWWGQSSTFDWIKMSSFAKGGQGTGSDPILQSVIVGINTQLAARYSLALLEDWSPAEVVYALQLPPGVTVRALFGDAAAQPIASPGSHDALPGGAPQFYLLDNPDAAWILRRGSVWQGFL